MSTTKMESWADESEDVVPEIEPEVEKQPTTKEQKGEGEEKGERSAHKSYNKDNNSRGNYRGNNNNRGRNNNYRGNSHKPSGKYEWNEVQQGRKGKNKFVSAPAPVVPRNPRPDRSAKDTFPKNPPFECVITDLDPETTEKEITDFFENAECSVTKITRKKDNAGAYVGFISAEHLRKALELHHEKLKDRTVSVELNTFFMKFKAKEERKKQETSEKVEPTASDAYDNSAKPNPFGAAKPVQTKEKEVEPKVDKPHTEEKPQAQAEENPKSEDKAEVEEKPKAEGEEGEKPKAYKAPREHRNDYNNRNNRGNRTHKQSSNFRGGNKKPQYQKEQAAPVSVSNRYQGFDSFEEDE